MRAVAERVFRYCSLAVSIAGIIVALFYLFRLTGDSIAFPSWTFVFYISFFWFVSAYARSTVFSKPLWGRNEKVVPRVLLAIAVLAVVILYYMLKLTIAGNAYGGRGPLIGIIVVQHVLVALVCTFGDRFLGGFRDFIRRPK